MYTIVCRSRHVVGRSAERQLTSLQSTLPAQINCCKMEDGETQRKNHQRHQENSVEGHEGEIQGQSLSQVHAHAGYDGVLELRAVHEPRGHSEEGMRPPQTRYKAVPYSVRLVGHWGQRGVDIGASLGVNVYLLGSNSFEWLKWDTVGCN